MKNYVVWIVNGLLKKDFVTDIVFRYTITVCQCLLWLPEEKPQLVLRFIIYRKVVSVNGWRLNDTLYQKLLILVYIC